MEFKDRLEALGVNVTEGLDRVMGDESLYEMMLGLFVDEVKGSPISLDDFNDGDHEKLAKQLHTLKGTCGNLSLTPLFEGYTESLGLLREERAEEAKAVYEKIIPVQEKIIACIEQR